MATLVEAAQRMMDLYYQNYAPNDKFLDLDDFKYQIAISYSAMLNALYQTERKVNKQMEGFSNIEIPAAWLIQEDEPLVIEYDEMEEKYFAKTKYPVYSFDWDNAANALQGVHSVGKHCVYRKISLNERKFRQIVPPVGIVLFYLNKPQEIVFWGAKKDTKIIPQYIPVVVEAENDCKLSDNLLAAIELQVLEAMFKAKNGNFIQKLDDQNPNIIPQQQVNPTAGKP